MCSVKLAGCTAKGNPCLPTMAEISRSPRRLTQEDCIADYYLYVRPQKFSRCIRSICLCLSYERKYGKSSNDIDMSTSCRWWICYYFEAMLSSRYAFSRLRATESDRGKRGREGITPLKFSNATIFARPMLIAM